jgi:hypothetical protein
VKKSNIHKVQVFIKPVDGQNGNYLAFYQSDILHSTFFLSFKDDIMGAIALNSFVDMLGKKYEINIELCLSDEKAKFHNQALLDIVTQKVLLSNLKREN